MRAFRSIPRSPLAPDFRVKVKGRKKFVAAESFKDSEKIRFHLGDNFKRVMLGKIEEGVPSAEFQVDNLLTGVTGTTLRKEVESNVEETMLAHVYELLIRQSSDKQYTLLFSGYWNLFLVRDVRGNVWVVCVRWRLLYDDWDVEAYTRGQGWVGGGQFLHRRPVGKASK